MANMVGVGPFITIPVLMSFMVGPQAMLGWLFAALICIPDGMIWSELGAAMPRSGGTYVYLREGFGREKFGRLMAFLFLWQFLLSGPLEIASGYIGFGNYLGYLWQDISHTNVVFVAMALGVFNIFVLYRRIRVLSIITVVLWTGTLITTLTVIVVGLPHFDPKVAFDFPPNAFSFSFGFFLGLAGSMRIGVYDYLGYYNICHIGDEVRDPGRTIPRSVIISVITVAMIYFTMNMTLIGTVSWREFVPAESHLPASNYIVSIFMERLMGKRFAQFFTLMILVTTYASVFALLLGYSRIPFAAAKDGTFFKVFGKLHPKKDFPYVSLLLIGTVAISVCFLNLGTVIDALLILRIVVQFIAQIGAVMLLRKTKPDMPRPYRIWFYPIPCFVALVGWVFLTVTAKPIFLQIGFGVVAAGVMAYFIWANHTKRWPFEGPGQTAAQ